MPRAYGGGVRQDASLSPTPAPQRTNPFQDILDAPYTSDTPPAPPSGPGLFSRAGQGLSNVYENTRNFLEEHPGLTEPAHQAYAGLKGAVNAAFPASWGALPFFFTKSYGDVLERNLEAEAGGKPLEATFPERLAAMPTAGPVISELYMPGERTGWEGVAKHTAGLVGDVAL